MSEFLWKCKYCHNCIGNECVDTNTLINPDNIACEDIQRTDEGLKEESSFIIADLRAELEAAKTERDEAQTKLNQVADQWKESQHKIKLLNMALRAANNGNDTDDLRYIYEPDKGIEQLKTLCNGVIVHIPVDWLTEIVDEMTTRADNLQAAYEVVRGALEEAVRLGTNSPEWHANAVKALSTTPDAGERVKALVSELKQISVECKAAVNVIGDNRQETISWFEHIDKLASQALVKYRGGATDVHKDLSV